MPKISTVNIMSLKMNIECKYRQTDLKKQEHPRKPYEW